MVTDAAPVTFHCNVEDCPAIILAGEAVYNDITGGGAALTVTVVDPVTEPAPLVAVSV